MMMEITGTHILGFLLAVISTAGGIWLRRLHDQLDQSREYADRLQRDLLTLQTHIASEYCRKNEISESIVRIEAKIDRLADKLDRKQDRVS